MAHPFDELRERLLHAGIAPHHVRRYLKELSDHFDDLLAEGMAHDLCGATAEEAAHARLGDDISLAAPMLARPELRSFTARYPWAVFGLGPLLMMYMMLRVTSFIEGLFLYCVSLWFRASGIMHPTASEWLKLTISSWNWFANYAAPLALVAFVFNLGYRQRTPARWILLGVSLVCILGGSNEIGGKWRFAPGHAGLTVAFAIGLTPPFSWALLVSSAGRAAVNLIVAGGAYWLWRRRNCSVIAG